MVSDLSDAQIKDSILEQELKREQMIRDKNMNRKLFRVKWYQYNVLKCMYC